MIGGISGWGGAIFEDIYVGEDVVLVGKNTAATGGNGREVGGIIGQMAGGGSITNCWFAGTIDTDIYSGGLIGNFNKSNQLTITNSLVTGTINSRITSTTNLWVGGFIGNYASSLAFNITDSVFVGTVDIAKSSPSYVGSLVGYDNNKITATDVYASTKNLSQPVSGSDTVTGVTELTEAQLTGDVAQTNASGLDWTNTWIAVQ